MKLFIKHDEPKPTKFSVGGMQDQYGVFELCRPSQTQAPCFAHQKKSAPLAFTSELGDNSNTYKPIVKVPWTLPIQPETYESDVALWNEVKQCLYDHIDLPEPEAYNVLAAWIFASWTLEKWTIAPYLFFFGTFGTGKTRALEVLSKLCSRGWLALYMTPANLYRPLEDWKPTLFLDEAEIYGDKHEIIGLLNGSYRKGQFVSRQKESDGDYETVFFDCFGFKAIAGTKDLAKTLRSRCIIFQTSNATRKIKFFVDESRCTQLRNKLLKWRFTKMLGPFEDIEHFEAFYERCEELVEVIGNQREVELFYPLLSVAPSKEIENEMIAYAKNSAGRKIEDMSLTTESQCLTAIIQAKERGLMDTGRIQIRDITNLVNDSLTFDEHWKERMTSSVCVRLGFQKVRGIGGRAVLQWNDKLIERLKKDKRYNSCFAPSPSELSSKSSNSSKIENWNCVIKGR
jgi:hypothetical protein